MDADFAIPSGVHDDPAMYLAISRFNRTQDFDFDLNGTPTRATVSYALTYAPPEAYWPVVVFFNGLGGHRLIAALIEGIAREHGVQVLTLDKHAAGGSVVNGSPSIPLSDRTRFMHAGLLAVLDRLRITRFAVMSHSNGLYYALYSLLNLPPTLTPTSWTLTGPFVPCSISGSTALRLASMLPAPLPNALGTLLQAAPAIGAAITWSGGLLSASTGLLSGKGDDQLDDRPAHKRGFLKRHVSMAVRQEVMRRGLAESRVSMGQEALFSLHGGEAVSASDSSPASSENCVWGIGPGATDADILRNAFSGIAARYLAADEPPGYHLAVNVLYGAEDGMVPKQGREWLRGVLEETGLIRTMEGDAAGTSGPWVEVPEAGHDDVLFLEEVVGGILKRIGG